MFIADPPDQVRAFDLLGNPFAVLGATPRTPLAELSDLSSRAGTPEAAAAVRILSVPRSRLSAEIAFLPGVADPGPVLAALARDDPFDLSSFPPAAAANVLAHRCAARLGHLEHDDQLIQMQVALGDPTLRAAIDDDRNAAGMPPLQLAVLVAEQDALLGRHAAALLASCLVLSDPPARLAELVRRTPDGPGLLLLRRTAAAWDRHSAAALDELKAQVQSAECDFLDDMDEERERDLSGAVQAWAALSAPQRLVSAKAGLAHEATVHLIVTWRDVAETAADDSRPDLALAFTRTLLDAFADVPGEGGALLDDVRTFEAQIEELAIEDQLRPLRELCWRIEEEPGPLLASLQGQSFDERASGLAGKLWATFDAACRATTLSDVPWTLVSDLAAGLRTMQDGTEAAVCIHMSLAHHAREQARADLATAMDDELFSSLKASAMARYRRLAVGVAVEGWLAKRRARQAWRRARAFVLVPGEREALLSEAGPNQAFLTRGPLHMRRLWPHVAAVVAVLAAVTLGSATYWGAMAVFAAIRPDRYSLGNGFFETAGRVLSGRPGPLSAGIGAMAGAYMGLRVWFALLGIPFSKAPRQQRRPLSDTKKAVLAVLACGLVIKIAALLHLFASW